jgi:uncharacterized protein
VAVEIKQVELSAAGFVGPTLKGPTVRAAKSLRRLTSFADFERLHGGVQSLRDGSVNFVSHAARAFFAEGGRALYVARTVSTDAEQVSRAVKKLDRVRDLGTVAAPGSSILPSATCDALHAALVAHAERHRRCAVLDSPPGATVADVRATRGRIDSRDAAYYYPWVVASADGGDVLLPPAGFVCGIFARTDAERGVHKAPANEPLISALRLERNLSAAEQEILNPVGVNCLRMMQGRTVIWGARTASDDPEFKYINVRRTFNCVHISLERGLRWVSSRYNTEALWAAVRTAVQEFLTGLWRAGALVGTKPEQAFFVRCDRSTMTQDDIDAGQLICTIGFAMIRPAEFITLRIERSTRVR